MRLSPRVSGSLLLWLAASSANAADVTRLLAAVAERARFAAPALATGQLVHRSDAGETRLELRMAGRRGTVRVDVGADRALVRLGKALVRTGDAAPRLSDAAAIGDTNVRFGDLSIFAPRRLDVPQIVDQGPSETVVAAAPNGASPYTLLVFTIDPTRTVVTQVKYYEFAINNLVKRDKREEFVEIAGSPRPTHLTMWDVQGSGIGEISLVWRPAPALGREPFTRAGLAKPLP